MKMSKFVIGCEVVYEFLDDTADKFVLKEKLGNDKWVAQSEDGLLHVLLQKNMFKVNRTKIKVGDYAYNPFSDCIHYVDEEDDLIYVNGSYCKLQNYKSPKERAK